MNLSLKILILSIGIISFFILSTSAGHKKYLIDTDLSENSPCDENAIFPEPPCCGVGKKHSSRISGGEIVELGELPWVVIIHPSGIAGSFGGGSLINSRWVLTAGHNVDKKLPSDLRVHLGILKRQNMKMDFKCSGKFCALKVEKIIIHEQFNSISLPIYDIALLRLAETVAFTDDIKPICLPLGAPEQYNFANKMAVVAGWGLTESGWTSDVLLKASVRVWESLNCQQHAGNASIQICAVGVEGTGFCTGDSGGPLMLPLQNDAYYQIGIVSYGVGCAVVGIPKIYVNVLSYTQWIKDAIMKNQ